MISQDVFTQNVLTICVPAIQDSDNRTFWVLDSNERDIVHLISTRHGSEEKFEPDIDRG